MLGLFDSGSGGLNTVRYIKHSYECADVVYCIDRANAPYGIKSENEIKDLTEKNIDELVERGADRVLIACCTASTVYDRLSRRHKEIAFPIIEPTAKAAALSTASGRIGVIATRRTVNCHAFKRALQDFKVFEAEAQELVKLIDSGLNDSTANENSKRLLTRIISPLLEENIDTLVLGCTHFPALAKTIYSIASPFGVKSIIDSAKEGADALLLGYE